jgi:AbrB family looped-hinge helix DNA binding protein
MSESGPPEIRSVSPEGRVTIPETFREELGIDTPGYVRFVRTEEGEIAVRPVRSVTDLRGVLKGKRDRAGRSAFERLRAERKRDGDYDNNM